METLSVLNRSLTGQVKVPSSKSIGHRLLICAALAEGSSHIEGLSLSKDILATMVALTALGATFKRAGSEKFGRVVVEGIGSRPKGHENGKCESTEEFLLLNCGESGSTLRFLIPVGLALKDRLTFTGEGRLVERPIDEYFPIFNTSGISYDYDGRLPISLRGFLKAGKYSLSGRVSSQYTTGMLLASPMLKGSTEIQIHGEMESKGYIDLTIEAMTQFGVKVERAGYNHFVTYSSEGYKAAKVAVEGDYSQGAFWIVAGLIGDRPIRIEGLNPKSVQGDAVVLQMIEAMGGTFIWEDEVLAVYPSATKGMTIDAAQCPDLIPIMCVLATQSDGETRVINGNRLRLKESDRIRSTVTELAKLGADIVETEDGMVIKGKTSLKGGCRVDGWNDHRIVMAASIAATVCEKPIEITGYEAVQKSYPDFFEDFAQLGGGIEKN